MERKKYLKNYRLCLDAVGIPLVIRRSANEATFQADEIKSGERVALQVIPPAALRKASRAELAKEGEAARKIQHLNIPRLRDFGFEADQLICVSDYFEGTSAEDWVKTKGPLPVGVVLRIASQILSALSAATFHGVEHHAVAPANIMLVPGQTAEGAWPLIKVLSFLGVAAREIPFVSPEQLRGQALDFRAQVYSLGCTLWFLLKGAPPPSDPAEAIEQAGFPAPLRRLLQPMLEQDPDFRPLDPTLLEEQIQHCLAQVERRDAVAGKFGLAPSAAEPALNIAENYPARRGGSWKPVALAAILTGAATIAALVLAERVPWREALGLPGKIAEASKPATPASIPENASAPASVPSAEPPTLVSTAVAPSEDDHSPNESLAAAEPTPAAEAILPKEPVLASDEAAEDSNPRVAENASTTEEPPPPAEGPEDFPMPSAPPAEVVSATPAPVVEEARPTPAPLEDVQKDVSLPAIVLEPAPGATASRTAKVVPRRTKESSASERPSAPPASSAAREEPRRRPRPDPREKQKELPVLPALPPDE